MNPVELRRVDPARNMRRFCRLDMQPAERYDTEALATEALQRQAERKKRPRRQTLTELVARDEIRNLVAEAVSMALETGLPIDKLRGVTLYDIERDTLFTSLSSYERARQAIITIPDFIERFGGREDARVVLQFIYQYFNRLGCVHYEEAAFQNLWLDLIAALHEVSWTFRGVANVRNFLSENYPLDLGEGIAIRGRSPADLASLGFDDRIWARLSDDWSSGGGASSFVLVVEHSLPKSPETFLLQDCSLWTKAARAIEALRLAEAGSISIGPMWVERPARFNVGIGGLTRIGASILLFPVPTIAGPKKRLKDINLSTAPCVNWMLMEIARHQATLGLLDVLGATYDRWPYLRDSQLLDFTTALEALLGTEIEISFRLSFRVASLIAGNESERANYFKLMKDFYNVRSRLVHGNALNDKHRQSLGRVGDDLGALVRRLLRSFVTYAVGPSHAYSKTFFKDGLDAALMDATEREKLRDALGLNQQ